jgi:FdhD protein
LRVLRIIDGKQEYVEDTVVEDVLFRIFINGDLVASMNVVREKLEELTFGYLVTSNYIKGLDEVDEILFDENDVLVKLTREVDPIEIKETYLKQLSDASLTPAHFVVKESRLSLTPRLIRTVMDELNLRGDTFKQTGGTHSALIYQDDKVVAFSEDVGRFNALDKVIGEALMNKIDLKNVILASSGRLAGEMVLKASNAGVPVMCSVSAPIKSGVNIAIAAGMTLIGFARGDKFNIYSGFERIA